MMLVFRIVAAVAFSGCTTFSAADESIFLFKALDVQFDADIDYVVNQAKRTLPRGTCVRLVRAEGEGPSHFVINSQLIPADIPLGIGSQPCRSLGDQASTGRPNVLLPNGTRLDPATGKPISDWPDLITPRAGPHGPAGHLWRESGTPIGNVTRGATHE